MFTNEQIQKLKKKEKTVHINILGILNQFNKYEIEINYAKLNPKQHFLFKRVLHGLKLYKKEEIDEDFASVKTIIVTKRKQEISINYRLHMVAGKWRVYDVVVNGVSLINTYRQQFRSIIKKSSYDGLVKILRRKRDEG